MLDHIYRTRLRISANKIRSIGNHSKLKIFVVSTMAVFLLAGVFYVPYRAFLFLSSLGHFGLVIIDRLLFLLFMGLFLMLVFSSAIINYSSAYKARETGYFFTLPLEYSDIYSVKLIDSVILSSWTFLCFLLPVFSAYAVIRELGWIFYLSLLVFFVPFAAVAGALGSIITLAVVRFIPKRFTKWIVWLAVFAFISACIWLIKTGKAAAGSENEVVFLLSSFIPHFGFTQNPFLPNFWISEGLFSLISGNYRQSVFWWLMLLSNALFFSHISITLSGRFYFESWTKSCFQGVRKIYISGQCLADKIFNKAAFIRKPIRAMIIKDIKVFTRDPLQWSQFTIFFGLLAIYFSNIRNLSYQELIPFWKNLISFLNLASTNLTLASLSVRFVFPQISLEGKRFWILGLAPVTKKEILLEKFWLNSLIALSISLPLIMISNFMLDVGQHLMLLSSCVVILMCFSLISICIGLGVLFPNFKEDNPAAIVSGFGGTLALVISLVYIGVNVAALAIPFHLFVTARISQSSFDHAILLSTVFVVLLGLATIFGFMAAARRALIRLEI